MKEILGAVGKVVGTAVKAAAPAVVRAPVAVAPAVKAVPTFGAAAKETAAGLASVAETVPAKIAAPVARAPMPFLAKVDMIAATGDGHRALSFLAFGNVKSEFVQQVASKLPEGVLRHDFVALEKLNPRSLSGVSRDIAALNIPKNVLQNPVFADQFYRELRQDIARKKDQMKKGELTAEEYMANRQQMLRQSASRAMEKSNQPTEKDLEKLKRKAALEAIHIQMLHWRQSVMIDKRLTPEAKERALVRIDRLESRLMLRESMRWNEGLSLVKLMALAALYLEDVAS